MLAIGLMSGTSMDGIDVALIETDGDGHVHPLAFHAEPYGTSERDRLRVAMEIALDLDAPQFHPLIDAAARDITDRHVDAVRNMLAGLPHPPAGIGVVGFHGQTIAHRPDRRWTWQIGDGARMAAALGLPVVNDFRSADVAAGGQGAPLVPVYHRARASDLNTPLLVLNLGGVGNLTFIGEDGDLIAFDTGPGNALIDDWVRIEAGLSHDEGGRIAARGTVRQDRLNRMLDHRWFDQPPPKSLDRHDFTLAAVRGLDLEDGAATLAAFTAASVARGIALLPAPPRRILVAGGGRHNATIMNMLGVATGLPVAPVETVGWSGDATEAEAFAYLAVRHLRGLPITFPRTTGVDAPLGGGRLHQPG